MAGDPGMVQLVSGGSIYFVFERSCEMPVRKFRFF
jgi:hypothetical protein